MPELLFLVSLLFVAKINPYSVFKFTFIVHLLYFNNLQTENNIIGIYLIMLSGIAKGEPNQAYACPILSV